MKIGALLVAAAAFSTFVQTASAAVVGSLDLSRTYVFTTTGGELREGALLGNYYSNLHGHIVNSGSSFAAGATTVTADYLSGVDLFITGTPTLNTNSAGRASAAEQTALRDWVYNGGVAFILGETTVFQTTANTWLDIFGLSISGNYGAGTGRWTASDNPLLDGVNEGASAAIALNAGGAFAAGGLFDDIFARYGTSATTGQIGIVGLQYGSGYVIASGDSSPFSNERFQAYNTDGVTPSRSANFITNILAMADANATPVPVPASLPLLLAGLLGLGLVRRKARDLA